MAAVFEPARGKLTMASDECSRIESQVEVLCALDGALDGANGSGQVSPCGRYTIEWPLYNRPMKISPILGQDRAYFQGTGSHVVQSLL